jgi:hypothetical protein
VAPAMRRVQWHRIGRGCEADERALPAKNQRFPASSISTFIQSSHYPDEPSCGGWIWVSSKKSRNSGGDYSPVHQSRI